MKQRNTMWRFNFLPLYDYDGIRESLERLSEQGWVIDRIGSLFWHYRRTEPKRRHVAVAYFPKASASDPGPSEGQYDFQQLCEDAGWELKAQWAQMQIFYSEEEAPIPIDTDPVQQLDTVHRSMRKSFLPSQWLLAALAVFQLVHHARMFRNDPVEVLSGSAWMLFLFWLVLLGVELAELGSYYRWRRRASAAAERGEWTKSLHMGKLRQALLWTMLALLSVTALTTYGGKDMGTLFIMAGYLCGMFAVMYLVFSFRDALKGLRVSAMGNRIATLALSMVLSFALVGLVIAATFWGLDGHWLGRAPAETYEYRGHTFDVYHDELPLTVQDLADVDYDRWSTRLETERSLLATHMEATQRGWVGDRRDLPELAYEIVTVRFSPFYGVCRDGLLRKVERYNHKDFPDIWDMYQPCDPAPWGAEEAFRLYTGGEERNQFLLCRGDRMAVLDLPYGWEVTDEIMAAAGERLLAASLEP